MPKLPATLSSSVRLQLFVCLAYVALLLMIADTAARGTEKWSYPRVIAHRGGGKLAPENTLSAIRTGMEVGILAVEFDVMLSLDGVPMLMHDQQLLRTVTADCSYRGKVFNTLTAEDLRTIDVGSWYDNRYSNERIPTLDSVIEYCIEHNIFMNIEIKPVDGDEVRTGRVVANTVKQYFDLLEQRHLVPLFSSFCFDALKAAKDTFADVPRGYLMKEPLHNMPQWEDRLRELDAVSAHLNHKHVTKDQIDALHSMGFGVFCYTVNDVPRARELLEMGLDAFCTDEVELFKDLARQLNGELS